MDYIVSARKYRPMTFDAVVGQGALTTTLKNAVKSGKLAHAFLFCGPRGVGKTTCARIFAKAINCMNPTADGEACNECESCQSFNEQRSFNIFELDAASNNTVEDIRKLMEQTQIPPQVGKYKVFIIDEVHMLSQSAFNAFLKTLEEPPSFDIFILATTEKHKILPTIISRCQIYDFDRMRVPDIINHLKMVAEKEGISYEEEALNVIAEKADGGMRDALSIFDQCASFCQNDLTYAKVIENLNVLDSDNYFRIIDLSLENKVSDIMVLLNDIIAEGFDGGRLINGLAAHVRNVLMARDEQTLPLIESSARIRERFREQAKRCPVTFLYDALKILNRCDINYRASSNKRLLVELTLIEVAQITQEEDSPGAGRRPARRIKSLFQKIMVNTQSQPARQVAASEAGMRRDRAAAQHNPATAAAATTATATAAAPAPAGTTDTPDTPKPAALKLSGITNTFANLRNKTQKVYVKEEEVVVTTTENASFTQEDLEREWYAMCARMPQSMVGLSSRMKNISPSITSFPHIELVIDSQLLLDELVPIRGRIRATMAKALHNKDIQFTLRLAKAEETKKILSKRELFENLRKENPAIEKLRDLLDLELS